MRIKKILLYLVVILMGSLVIFFLLFDQVEVKKEKLINSYSLPLNNIDILLASRNIDTGSLIVITKQATPENKLISLGWKKNASNSYEQRFNDAKSIFLRLAWRGRVMYITEGRPYFIIEYYLSKFKTANSINQHNINH